MSNLTALNEAIIHGNKKKILELLEKDVDPKTIDDKGDTFLHIAFRNVQSSQPQLIEILKIFLDNGLDINIKNDIGKTILHLAVEGRMRDVIDYCLNRNADRNSIAHFIIESECRKFHSLIESDVANNFELEEKNSSSFIKWMVSRNIDFITAKNEQTCSALFFATHLNLQHIVFTLLKHVKDLAPVEKDETPLLCVYLEKINGDQEQFYNDNTLVPIADRYYGSRYHESIVKIILQKNHSIDDKTLVRALQLAIANKFEPNVIDVILERISSVQPRESSGEPLIVSFTELFYEWTRTSNLQNAMRILRTLALKGADVNVRDIDGRTMAQALFCHHPNLEMLELLKEIGADFQARTNTGEGFLNFIARHGRETRMVDWLLSTNRKTEIMNVLESGVKVKDVSRVATTAIVIACKLNQVQLVKNQIERGADLKNRDSSGKTLLHLAIDNLEIVKLLVENGADVNAKDYVGTRPLHLARSATVIHFLVKSGAHVDAPDDKERTPLFTALFARKSEVILEFLKCGADVCEPNVFALAIQNYETYPNAQSHRFYHVKRQLIRLAAIGLLHKLPHAPMGIQKELQNFDEQCHAEVALLKTIFIDDSTSLYKFLIRNRNRKCAYVNEEKLKNLVGDPMMQKKCLNYSVLIQGCYYEAVARKPLLAKFMIIWGKLTNVCLPDLCVDKILVYLSNLYLVRFIEAYENI